MKPAASFLFAIVSIGLVIAAPSLAADDAVPEEKPHYLAPLGDRVDAWLARQRRGEAASARANGLVPPADRRARTRYLRSFEHAQPDLFDSERANGAD